MNGVENLPTRSGQHFKLPTGSGQKRPLMYTSSGCKQNRLEVRDGVFVGFPQSLRLGRKGIGAQLLQFHRVGAAGFFEDQAGKHEPEEGEAEGHGCRSSLTGRQDHGGKPRY
jgi:hypothetical protein